MTALAQAKLMAQPFIAIHSDFVFKNRSIFRTPLRHVSLRFYLDRLSAAEYFRTSWGAGVLFYAPSTSGAGVGNFMDGASGNIDDPEFAARFLGDLERVNADIFPQVESLKGLLDFPWVPFLGTGKNPIMKSLLLASLGRFEEAEAQLSDWIRIERAHLVWNAGRISQYYRKGSKRWRRQQDSHEMLEGRVVDYEKLRDLLVAGQPAPIAAILHEWEALAVKKRGIERYWEPSPFPFEVT